MARDNDAARTKIETAITFVFQRVGDEYATRGAGGKFVGRRGVQIRETQTAEDAKMIICRLNAGEEEIRCVGCCFGRRAPVEKVSGCV